MQVNTERRESIKKLIREKKVVSFESLHSSLDCSIVTLRRDLKTIQTMTSFTHRGHYVTLSNTPHFNEHGLWFYRKVGFSKFGTSLKTIINLIDSSKEGFSREELEVLLKIGISKQIQILIQEEKIHRIKLCGKYLYIPESALKNKKKRLKIIGTRQEEERFEKGVQCSDVIALLKVVLIEKKIDMNFKTLKNLCEKYYLKISIKKIEQLLLKYKLSEKKRHRLSR